jgi:hypothetical protein
MVFVTAAFLIPGAQAAFALPDPAAAVPAEQAAGVGTTGAQTTSACPEPRLKGLPKHATKVNATVPFKITGMTQGTDYLIKFGRGEVQSGAVAQTGTVKNTFKVPEQGPKSRKIAVVAIVSNTQCENSPWKLTKKLRYKGVPLPETATPPATAPTQTPVPTTPPNSAIPTPGGKPVKPPTPASTLPKLPPKGPLLTIRTWLTPLDGGSRLDKPPTPPELSRTERRAEKASSSAALVGLAGLFVLLGVSVIGGLVVLKRRDDVLIEEAMGVLPQHLDEGSPDMHEGEEPETAPLHINGAAASEPAPEAVPAAEVVPEPVLAGNGNGQPSPAHHRAQVEAELQRLLTEAGVEAELGGIIAEAKAEAERSGVAIDSDVIVRALTDELNGVAALSESKRAGLRSMFAEIVAEETSRATEDAERVPENAS